MRGALEPSRNLLGSVPLGPSRPASWADSAAHARSSPNHASAPTYWYCHSRRSTLPSSPASLDLNHSYTDALRTSDSSSPFPHAQRVLLHQQVPSIYCFLRAGERTAHPSDTAHTPRRRMILALVPADTGVTGGS